MRRYSTPAPTHFTHTWRLRTLRVPQVWVARNSSAASNRRVLGSRAGTPVEAHDLETSTATQYPLARRASTICPCPDSSSPVSLTPASHSSSLAPRPHPLQSARACRNTRSDHDRVAEYTHLQCGSGRLGRPRTFWAATLAVALADADAPTTRYMDLDSNSPVLYVSFMR